MANKKISDLTALTTPVSGDLVPIVDISDTTDAATGTTKKVTITNLAAAIGGVADTLVYKGTIDCSANPNYPAADAGHIYIVSVAGKIGGASGVVVEVGDLFVCKTDSTSSGTQAAVGANWDVIQTNIAYTPEDVANKDTDGTLAADSDTKYASQKATKTYVDTAVAGVGGGITELTGDVTAGPGSGSQSATIANDAVTYAKMQDVSAASRILGRGSSGGAGNVQELQVGAGLSISGTTISADGSGGGGTTIVGAALGLVLMIQTTNYSI
jgi:hypothetical protein